MFNLKFICRIGMSESLPSHVILCECLAFSEGKTRPEKIDEKSTFLSSLALILSGNSSCTAVYVHRVDQVVLVARNEPITAIDERYFDRFFRQIRIYANVCFDKEKARIVSDVDAQLRSLVFEYNSKKIIKRVLDGKNRMGDQLRRMSRWNSDEKSRFVDELRSHPELYRNRPLATEKVYLLSKNFTEEDYVQILFTKLAEFLTARDELIDNQSNPTDKQLAVATRRAFVLYESRLFRYILGQSDGTAIKGVCYFEKISAHERSINLLLKCLLYRKDQLSSIYQNISWKLIPSIENEQPLTITPRQAFERIFSQLPRSTDESLDDTHATISSESFYDEHMKKLARFEQHRVLLVQTHAEILLIDHLLTNKINESHDSSEVEIGISKMPCLLCSHYIDLLNRKHDRCFVASDSTNGKISSKWAPRNNEDPSILQSINQKLIAKLQRSIQKLCLASGRAPPKKSGDSDVMYTSLDGDEFDAMLVSELL